MHHSVRGLFCFPCHWFKVDKSARDAQAHLLCYFYCCALSMRHLQRMAGERSRWTHYVSSLSWAATRWNIFRRKTKPIADWKPYPLFKWDNIVESKSTHWTNNKHTRARRNKDSSGCNIYGMPTRVECVQRKQSRRLSMASDKNQTDIFLSTSSACVGAYAFTFTTIANIAHEDYCVPAAVLALV